MSEIVKAGWSKYLLQLQSNPLRTKAITAGALSGISDIIAQKIAGVKKLQFKRVALLMLYGLSYGGPFGHYFYKLMDKIFQGKKGNATVVKKVLSGRSWGLVKNKIQKDYAMVQLTAWKFWPVVGWINYQYVPIHLRVLFGSFVSSCWAIFLNLRARSVTAKKD